jgi:hypothetical protein
MQQNPQMQSVRVEDKVSPGIDRKALSEEIKSLEATLASLPASTDTDDVRALILQKIENKKVHLRNAKPIGARVDACRECVTRCRERASQCERSVELAKQALAEAQHDLSGKQNELVALETELASTEVEPHQPNSIEELAHSLSRVMKEMEAGGCVPANIMQETLGHMASLMTGVKTIAAEARKPTLPTGVAPHAAHAGEGDRSGHPAPPGGGAPIKHQLDMQPPSSKHLKVDETVSIPTSDDVAPMLGSGKGASAGTKSGKGLSPAGVGGG